MKLRVLAATAAIPLFLLAACSSSKSSTPATPVTGTETLTAVATGSQVADNLNSNSNAPLTFADGGSWTGLIVTSVKPFALGGNSVKGNAHWATPEGTTTVYHASAAGFTNNNAPPPAADQHWVKSGTDCIGTVTFSKGTFQFLPKSSTGRFAQLSGTGTYSVITTFTATLAAGKTTCTLINIGKVISNSSDKITFIATAPATLKPVPTASATP